MRTLSYSLKFRSPDEISLLPISCIVWKPSLTAISLSSGVVACLKIASLRGFETTNIS